MDRRKVLHLNEDFFAISRPVCESFLPSRERERRARRGEERRGERIREPEEGAGRKVEKGAQELMRGGEVPAESGERKREEKKKESGERPYHSPPASLQNLSYSTLKVLIYQK